MKVLGYNYSTNADGVRVTTLQLADNFNDYFSNPEKGRGCSGQKVESVYVGTYDCSGIKVGSDIDILYDKAVTNTRGTFQPIKRIEIIGK